MRYVAGGEKKGKGVDEKEDGCKGGWRWKDVVQTSTNSAKGHGVRDGEGTLLGGSPR